MIYERDKNYSDGETLERPVDIMKSEINYSQVVCTGFFRNHERNCEKLATKKVQLDYLACSVDAERKQSK